MWCFLYTLNPQVAEPSPNIDNTCILEVLTILSMKHDRRESEDVTKGTSEVVIAEDGVCSVKCFDEGLGSCVLSLTCAATGDTLVVA